MGEFVENLTKSGHSLPGQLSQPSAGEVDEIFEHDPVSFSADVETDQFFVLPNH